MINTIFYYILFASAVFIYGIGLNTLTIVCSSEEKIYLLIIKTFLSVLCSSVLSWLVTEYLLIPLDIIEIYPLISLLIFISISIFFETLIRITTGKITSEFSTSFLIIILAINESISITDVILISLCCFFSMIILIPLVHSLKRRIDITGNAVLHGNFKSLLLISIAIIITAAASGNISWLNKGVLH